jgi:hypothetical protein
MWAKRLAMVLWVALSVVTWNVVFDRAVWTAAERFTNDNLERYQRGEPVPTINEAYRPAIRVAALHASLWAGGVFAVGGLALVAGHVVLRRVHS